MNAFHFQNSPKIGFHLHISDCTTKFYVTVYIVFKLVIPAHFYEIPWFHLSWDHSIFLQETDIPVSVQCIISQYRNILILIFWELDFGLVSQVIYNCDMYSAHDVF